MDFIDHKVDVSSSPIVLNGDHVGELHRFGFELHFEAHPEYRHLWATRYRAAVIDFIRQLLEEPMVTTRVGLHQHISLRLVPRLGFSEMWRDETHVYYVLDRLPFERKRI